MNKFTGVKVFSVTMWQERAQIGERVTAWIAEHPNINIVNYQVVQSSDNAFHCISILVFFRDTKRTQ